MLLTSLVEWSDFVDEELQHVHLLRGDVVEADSGGRAATGTLDGGMIFIESHSNEYYVLVKSCFVLTIKMMLSECKNHPYQSS